MLERGYRTRFGEIDIIVSRDSVVAFVEVKLRNHHYFDLSQVITLSKQRKIIKSAHAFIARNCSHLKNYTFRFDVALIEVAHDQPQLTYLPHAFTDQHGNSWY